MHSDNQSDECFLAVIAPSASAISIWEWMGHNAGYRQAPPPEPGLHLR